ncbi:hypothetical protein [Paenibacillus graminis]|uniref:hypothetical protein n=1 Tax=Paenibacillus graminis TaxID=189425 RepID=UPI002DB6039D|nr:hypothetical protein [Paenibacillus graminis]MEC0169942.1 hypothetical protein [Paenibacillus graminis]
MTSIIPLNKELIHQANYNSFGGTRGNTSDASYRAYALEILEWNIADTRKEKLLTELHKRYSEIIKYEAQHVSIMVAGPARYNPRKLDKSDKILSLSADFCEWFEGVKEQVKSATKESNKAKQLLEMIQFCDNRQELNPTDYLMKLASIDNTKFIEIFEKLYEKYRWRKNSNIYKLYLRSKNGEVQEIRKEVVFQDDNIVSYKEGERYYIKFVMRPKRQLIVALKSRGWWWNARENAWSTYVEKYDQEWVSSISTRYAVYV